MMKWPQMFPLVEPAKGYGSFEAQLSPSQPVT